MNGMLYTRYELVRAFRNRRFFFFSLGFPLVLFVIIAGPQSGNDNFAGSGVSVSGTFTPVPKTLSVSGGRTVKLTIPADSAVLVITH